MVSKQEIEHAGWSLYPPAYLAQDDLPGKSLRLGDVASITRGIQNTKDYLPARSDPRYLLNIVTCRTARSCLRARSKWKLGI